MGPRELRWRLYQERSFLSFEVVRADPQGPLGGNRDTLTFPTMYGDLRAFILSGQFLRHPHSASIGKRPFLWYVPSAVEHSAPGSRVFVAPKRVKRPWHLP